MDIDFIYFDCFNLGVLLQTVATEKKLLIAGRAIAGTGVGLISSVILIIFRKQHQSGLEVLSLLIPMDDHLGSF